MRFVVALFFVFFVQRTWCGDVAIAGISHPQFTVVVNLSPLAEAALRESKRKVIVYGVFADAYGPGMKILNEARFELTATGSIVFDGITIPKRMLEALRDKNYEVYVGAEATGDARLIRCNYVQGLIADLQGRSISLLCKSSAEH
jgi:hypothetical protein